MEREVWRSAHVRRDALNIMVTGSHGLIGNRLVADCRQAGHTVYRLARQSGTAQSGTAQSGTADPQRIVWDPTTGRVDGSWPEDLDTVVHLAGASIAAGRWTKARMAAIRDSRVVGTQRLSAAIADWQHKPSVLVCASAIGYYGDRGDEELRETSGPGTGFLADVCQQWEAATQAAEQAGVRVVHLRLGMVLSPDGGALQKMLLPFKLGLGGIVGNGRQYWSSVFLDDALAAVHHACDTPALQGPVNVVGPQPVTNREFTRILGKVLRRPTLFPMPRIMGRLVLGKMVDDLMIASARVLPHKLLETGFDFRFAELESGFRAILGTE